MKVLKIVWLVIFIGWGYLLSGCGETEAEKHFRQGNEYDSQGKYEQAIDSYQKAIEIDPTDFMAYYNRGNAKAGLKDYSGAITDYNKAVEINPRYYQLYSCDKIFTFISHYFLCWI